MCRKWATGSRTVRPIVALLFRPVHSWCCVFLPVPSWCCVFRPLPFRCCMFTPVLSLYRAFRPTPSRCCMFRPVPSWCCVFRPVPSLCCMFRPVQSWQLPCHTRAAATRTTTARRRYVPLLQSIRRSGQCCAKKVNAAQSRSVLHQTGQCFTKQVSASPNRSVLHRAGQWCTERVSALRGSMLCQAAQYCMYIVHRAGQCTSKGVKVTY